MQKSINRTKKSSEPTPEEAGKRIIENIENEIAKMESKDFKLMFFVMDTKGNPIGSLQYIYETALSLKKMGYKVSMLHAEKDFMGVASWMGDEYASLPHYNIETDGLKVSPSDFLFIPELYSNLMHETSKLPCKRVVILQNLTYLTELIQPGAAWGDYGIRDCITTSNSLKKYITNLFPYLNVSVVRPRISELFKDADNLPKKLFINVMTKEKEDMNKIVKEFFWRYPIYKWLSFRDIRNLSQDILAETLKDSFATIWVDTDTSFGYVPLQAMKMNNIVIGKIPENVPEWMLTKDGAQLRNNAVWFSKTSDVYDIIVNVVEAFLMSKVPQEIYDEMEATVSEYTEEKQISDIESVYVNDLFEKRKESLKNALTVARQNVKN